MKSLRALHLARTASRLASLLPGVDDAAIFCGSREVLDAWVARTFDVPSIHRLEGRQPISYAQALAMACASSGAAGEGVVVEPMDAAVSILLAGLSSGPATLAAREREQLPADLLLRGLDTMLRAPRLHLLLRVRALDDFVSAAARSRSAGEVTNLEGLRLGQAVSMRVSFNAARALLADPAVLAWQAPGEVVLSASEGEL